MRDFAAATVVCLALASNLFAVSIPDGPALPPQAASGPEQAFAPVEADSGTSSPTGQEKTAAWRPASDTSIPPEQLRALLEKTDDYYSTKHAAVACGVTGTVLFAGGYVALVVSVIDETMSNVDNNPNNKNSSGIGTLGYAGIGMMAISIPLFVVSTVEIVQSIVKGVQLKQYENHVGYRISVVPEYDLRTRSSGALARLEF